MADNEDSDFLWAPVPFDKAAAMIADKGVVSRRVFDDLLPEFQGAAFVITHVEDMDLVMSIQQRVAELPLGGDWDEIKQSIAKDLSPWLDSEEDPDAAERRAELLLRSHGYAAYSAANHEALKAQRDLFPYLKYITAQDERVRGPHAALNGLVLPADSPFWDAHTPPWEFGCRCDKVGMMEHEVEEELKIDRQKTPSERMIYEAGSSELAMLEQKGRIIRRAKTASGGYADQEVDVTRDPNGFKYRPGDVSLLRNVDLIRQRYPADLWRGFQAWAELHQVGDGRTVWDWLNRVEAPNPASSAAAKVAVKAVAKKASKVSKALAAHRAANPPVSDAIEIQPRIHARKEAGEALAAIEQVHGDGKLAKIPLHGKAAKDTLGHYASHSRSGLPIEIAIKGSGKWKRLTTAHEVGHYLDHHGLGPVAGQFESERRSTPAWQRWHAAVSQTPTMRQIAGDFRITAKNRAYYLSDREVFARGYAQWIAQRSGNPAMLSEVALTRASPLPWRQWPDDEFGPIADAMDAIFAEAGWLRP